jgi:hypothetical protein
MKRLTDTSPEAERVLIEIYRVMPAERKLRLQANDYEVARALHEAHVLNQNPQASCAEVRDSWNARVLGDSVWNAVKRGAAMDDETDPLAVLRAVVLVLEKLGINYAIGGSWASSFYGIPRMTRDADVSVEPFFGKERELASAFGDGYYVSLAAIKQALRDRSTFNIIHFASGFKIDIFVQGDDAFARSVMARRRTVPELARSSGALVIVSAEDIILLKLRWYRLGDEISDMQWSDILGVLRAQAEKLDREYLAHWALELRVGDLLDRALAEAEPEALP